MKFKTFLISLLVYCSFINIPIAKNKTTLSLVLDWYPNAIHTVFYVAMKKGYFSEKGIKLKIMYPASTSDPISLVAMGRADFGLYYPHQTIIVKSQNKLPVVSLGSLIQGSLNVVASPKKNNIKRPRDLEGKKLGSSSGILSLTMTKNMVKKDGGDASKIKFIDVGFDLISSMITNRVDAASGCYINHEIIMMEEKGVPMDYFYPTDFGVPSYNELMILANSDKVKKNRMLYLNFLNALKKAFKYTKAHPEEALSILLANQEEEQFPLSKKVETKSLKTLLAKMELDNAPFLSQTKKMWQENINWMYDEKIIKNKIKADSIYMDITKGN